MQKRSSIPPDDGREPLPVVTGDGDEIVAGQEQPDSSRKNPAAVALGRLGGLKGGRARAAKLSAEQRSEVARRAAQARWAARSK